MIQLFEFAASGNCHKVRLLLSLLGQTYQSVTVNGADGEQKSAAFRKINPMGQVPVLRDDDTAIRDSQAILFYLARRYGGGDWLPSDPALEADVVAWLSTAANEVARGPADLRMHFKWGRAIDVAKATSISQTLLSVLEARLSVHDWLVGERPSIADIAVFPYIALAPEARMDLGPYRAVTDWLRRIQALPGYVGMPGMIPI